ncbi:MAG: hypothetical protein POELPBGB_01163 [Bacteroidia bacterium]|nr:hypothetical protein [Bacteroidia bacterium]
MKKLFLFSTVFLFAFLQQALSQTWPSTLGVGMNNNVNTLAVDQINNVLYAGGEFTTAGGISASKIAKWTGSAWEAMGTGVNGNVYSMLFNNGKLYIGGTFNSVDGVAANNVAMFDGTWHALGEGLTGGSVEVRSLVWYNNELVAGGSFTTSGVWTNLGNIARFDGTDWTQFQTTGANNKIWTLKEFNGDLIAGGQFTSIGNFSATAVARWDGVIWNSMGNGLGNIVRALEVYNNSLYAGGTFSCNALPDWSSSSYSSGIAQWSGNEWQGIGSAPYGPNSNCNGFGGGVYALAQSGGELFAGGNFTTVGVPGSPPSTDYAYRIARGDGQLFRPVENGIAPGVGGNISFQAVHAIAVYNNMLVLGGRFIEASSNVTITDINVVGFITLLNPPPVAQITVSHDLEFHHLGMENPFELFATRADVLPTSHVKICADGSKSTLFKIDTKGLVSGANIQFRIKSDPTAADPQAYGKFEAPDYSVEGNVVTARYTHPQYIPTSTTTYVADSVQIINASNSQVIYTLPVRFFRAPVTLVHGIWSDGDFWKQFEEHLWVNGFPAALTYRPDYKATNAVYFAQNDSVVPKAITHSLRQARDANYSAGKVDIIVHSMGGILTRLYLQGFMYNNDINKFLSCNSVHSGTQACNMIVNPNWQYLRDLFDYLGMRTHDGATDDFLVDSYAIWNDLNGSSMNDVTVPTHALTSNISGYTFLQSITGTWGQAFVFFLAGSAAPLGYMSVEDLLFATYNSDPHDVIVAEPSQRGGCSKFTSQYPYWHSGWKDEPSEFPTLLNLAKQAAFDNTYFTTSGFNPPLLSSIWINGEGHEDFEAPVSYRTTDSVYISNLAEGDTITSNIPFTFNLEATGNVQRMVMVVASGTEAMIMVDTAGPSAAVTMAIPNQIFEKAKVALLGYDNTGILFVDTFEIVVQDYNGYSYTQLQGYPEKLFLTAGKKGSFMVDAKNTSNQWRNVSYSDSLVFEVLDPAIASNVTGNIFKAHQPGETQVALSYRGLVDTVIIVVDDTVTIPDIITNVEQNGNEQADELFSLSADETNLVITYPNPATHEIIFAATGSFVFRDAIVEITDITGRTLARIEKLNGTQYSYSIDHLNKGIYLFRITAGDKIISAGKFVKM